jgi:hypothetical protein
MGPSCFQFRYCREARFKPLQQLLSLQNFGMYFQFFRSRRQRAITKFEAGINRKKSKAFKNDQLEEIYYSKKFTAHSKVRC